MPHERMRSIIQARDFLVVLSRDQALPEPIRNEARRLLRHYPTSNEILLAGKVEEHMKNGFTPLFLSSTIEDRNV
ncbi:BPSL0761 family protein [Pseudomonas sp. PSB11]|uniref:BPSL0761 family protein n=1 Tax=Pseudomonas sp. PSB11 TaxID=2021969 RepID=UPI002948B7FF|nr:BPSL0761 family protein [Pseudomonas sp. PSB11]